MTQDPASILEATPTTLRVLSCNILAGGSVKRYREYVTQSWKHVLPTGKRANLDGLAGMLGDFDLVALQEADSGSLRSGFLNQTEYLAESAGFPYWSHQPNRKVAKVAASSNGLLSRLKPDEVLDYPLPGAFAARCVVGPLRQGRAFAGRAGCPSCAGSAGACESDSVYHRAARRTSKSIAHR